MGQVATVPAASDGGLDFSMRMKLSKLQAAHPWVNPKEIAIAFQQTRFHMGKVEQCA